MSLAGTFESTWSGAPQALADLRAARRRKRLQQIHWVDAFYHVYLAAVVGLIAVLVLSNFVGGDRVGPDTMQRVREHGPALLGVVVAVAVWIGLRSGSRGGPIALEGPDVRHVLMSPVDRSLALRPPAWRQLRFAVFIGTVVGAIAGLLAHPRLGHNAVAFAACGAAFGATVAALAVACALVASGRRLGGLGATAIGVALLGWAVADAAGKVGAVRAPTTFLGRLALWPLHFDPVAIVPIIVVAALAAFGLAGVAGISVEQAERRTWLVGQLRFAVTLQDLRTVLVLRRQLAMELPRLRPWFGRSFRRRPRFPVWSRGWRGVLRWPAVRVVRMVMLGIVAGLCMRAVWAGSIPLVLVAGLALWIAGLDAVEPLAQETDHPTRRDGYPWDVGTLMYHHLAVPTVIGLIVAVFAGAAAVLAKPSVGALAVAAVAVVPAGAAAMAGAAASAVLGAPKPPGEDAFSMAPPEFVGGKNAIRAAFPPAVTIIGVLPVVAARAAFLNGKAVLATEAAAAVGVLVLVQLVALWVRTHLRIANWFSRTMEEAKELQKNRDAGRSGGRYADESE